MGASQTFVVGPMCIANRNSGEPPGHRDCAEFAVQACPFILRPNMVRREDERTVNATGGGGVMIPRNPGVVAVYTSKDWKLTPDPNGKPLWNVGNYSHISWWREGRSATFAGVEESITSGAKYLFEICDSQEEHFMAQKAIAKALSIAYDTTKS